MRALQIWVSLQTRRGGRLSATLTGTAPQFVGKMPSIGDMTNPTDGEAQTGTVLGDHDQLSKSTTLAAGASLHGGEKGEAKATDRSGGAVAVEVLCTGSLYAVAAALKAFGADVV